MKKILFCLLCIVTINSVLAANLTIEADRQEYSGTDNKAVFEGNVKVQLDDVTIQSPTANAEIDKDTNKIKLATFNKNAYVYQVKNNKKNEVKADIIKLSLLNNLVVAEGNSQIIVTENKKLEPVVTVNADKQEYNTETKVMTATGDVIIVYEDSTSYSDKAVAKMDKNGDVQELQIIGNAKIKQEKNRFNADKYTYKTATGDVIAIGNVYSEIHDDKKEDLVITVKSGFQQYNRNANTLVASKDVFITYKDYTAEGPKANVFPDPKTGKLNKVVFSGRSKITEKGRTIEADRIVMTMEPKNFTAEGNVKSFNPNVKSISND